MGIAPMQRVVDPVIMIELALVIPPTLTPPPAPVVPPDPVEPPTIEPPAPTTEPPAPVVAPPWATAPAIPIAGAPPPEAPAIGAPPPAIPAPPAPVFESLDFELQPAAMAAQAAAPSETNVRRRRRTVFIYGPLKTRKREREEAPVTAPAERVARNPLLCSGATVRREWNTQLESAGKIAR
jgi:hypothetical protein